MELYSYKIATFFELCKSSRIKIHNFCIFLSLKFVHVKIFLYLCGEFVQCIKQNTFKFVFYAIQNCSIFE